MPSIVEWLTSHGLGEYAPRFVENAISIAVLGELTEQDLKDLGLPLGHRRMLLRAVADMQCAASAKPQTPDEAPREAERRPLTILFCDMVGSTRLSAQLDPEDMRAVIRAFHGAIAAVVTQHFGMVARYMGDGVLAYFGFPQAHEDDAEEAVRAGLAMVDAVGRLRANVTGESLQARVGIATGTVVVGDLLIGEGREQAVVGETPNLAARLQALAEPGTVMICANTRRLTEGQFEFRTVGPVAIRGWPEPTTCYRVLGATEVESRFQAQHKEHLTSLLGRDEEIELLLRRWAQAKQGEGRVVVLSGEPGIGKSHIALALQEQLKGERHTRLNHFCSAHHTNSALFPFIAQLERAAQFARGDSAKEKLEKLQGLLAQSGAEPEHVALIANLLSLPGDERDPLPDLPPQKRKEKTLAALLAQLAGLAALAPVLVVFEDVHWIDPTSLELLALTVDRVQDLPVLLIITARSEFTPPWPSHTHVTTIPLTRLGRRDGMALIERIAGGKALPDEVVKQILARTDGVPLFVEELTKTVLESGLLQEQHGQYVLERPLPSVAIPTTLHGSLMARLDRLSPVRDVAQIGAVVGREFSYELLNAVSGMPPERLNDALNELVRSGLVYCRGEIPHAIYSFKHVLVREAAYAGLLKSRRALLHAAIASAFEQRFPEIGKGEPETLAHHLSEAGLMAEAVAYWLQAGKNAAQRSANLEAVAHLQQGIEATKHLPAGERRDRTELDLHLVLGPCLIATQGPAASKAVATFARARELCERLGQPPEYPQVLFWLATASVVRGELPQALDAIANLPGAAEARGNLPAMLNAIRGQAMILMFMGRLTEAREKLERAIDLFGTMSEADKVAARSAGQDAGMSILALMAWVCWTLGHVDEAVERMARALERADAVQHAHTHAYAWYYASVLNALRGEPTAARDYAERCLAVSEQHGFKQWIGLCRAIRGICTAMLDASATLHDAKAALKEYQGAGYQLGITAQFVLLSPALLLHNEPEAALEVIEQGLAIANHNSERLLEAELYRLKGRALLMRGGPHAEVESLLDQALRTARGQRARSLELRAATDMARLWAQQGKHAEARAMLGSIHERPTEGLDTPETKEVAAVLALLR